VIWGAVVGCAGLVGLAVLVAVVAMTPDPPRKQAKDGASDADSIKVIVSVKREKKKADEPEPGVNEAAPAGAEKQRPAAEVTPAPAGALTFDDWPQDLAVAKGQAARDGKDILLVFDGSDWCGYSKRLAQQVLLTPTFRRRASEQFVLVFLDFPRGKEAQAKVQDAARNARLEKQFGVEGFPTLILADAQGRPYAVTGYHEFGPEEYSAHLLKLQEIRIRRDTLLAAVGDARGAGQLAAARKALAFLFEADSLAGEHVDLLGQYGDLLDEWARLAGAHDPKNERGDAEHFFLARLQAELRQGRSDPKELDAAVRRLDEWLAGNKPRDANAAAEVYLRAGMLLSFAGQSDRAVRCFKSGLGCRPADAELARKLTAAAAGKYLLSSGTGFVVAEGGYILTNRHVADSPGRLQVQLTRDGKAAGDLLPARMVAAEEGRDIALIQVDLPGGVRLAPLVVAGKKELRRGAVVFGFGYPLVQQLGLGIKMEDGKITGLPDAEVGGMLQTSARINPGNSGGPLCDASANVIGMVTAKTGAATPDVTSVGLALPARDLEAFLLKHLKGYRLAETRTRELRGEEVDGQVTPSVVRVLKVL
jgi:S1-C subfamily serine protease